MIERRATRVSPHREATVSIAVVRGLAEAIERLNVSRDALFRAAGLEPAQMNSTEARLPRRVVYRLCELAIELTGNAAFGLHWAERLEATALPPISYLIAHTTTLRGAFESLDQFERLLSDDFGYDRCEQDGVVTVRCLSLPGESAATQRFVTEMVMVGMFRLVRYFNPHARLERVSFDYSAPSYADEYARIFEGAARFDEPFTGIVFDSALMDAPSPRKDADLHDMLRSVAARRVLRLTKRTPHALRVRDILVLQRSPHHSKMPAIARTLEISVRSLRRRLADEGTSFEEIRNEGCAIVAKRLLLDEQRAIQDAAFEMGFSDPTAFHRAFKRWTGMTPSAFREQELGSGEPRETELDHLRLNRSVASIR